MNKIPLKILKYLLIAFLVLSINSTIHAQTDILIDLSKETREEVSIAVTGFQATTENSDPEVGVKGRKILEDDLKLFEIFVPLDHESYKELENLENGQGGVNYGQWNSLGAQWLIKTQYETQGKDGKIKFTFRLYDVINERFLLGKRYQGTRSFIRKIMHRFADKVMEELTGKPGVAETQIAFLSRTEQGKEMYAVDFDGANISKLTNEKSVVLSPDWSPDGRSIVFTSFQDHNPDLIMVDSSGRRRRVLLKLPGLNSAPAWSPDGTKISLVLSRDQNSEIYILNRWRKLTRLTRHFNIDTSPSWSPDGKKIAFTSDRSGTGRPQVYIMDSENGDRMGVTRISYGSTYNDNPAWSPDGDKIAYTSLVGKEFQIKIYYPESKKTVQITNGPGSKEEPSWSPDGRFIAYHMTQGKQSSIQVRRIGSPQSRSITKLDIAAFSPTWSPYPNK